MRTAVVCGWMLTSLASATPLTVAGWPFLDIPKGTEPPFWLGDDPVVGRLACPSLTRLDLVASESEGLILKDIVETAGKRPTWELQTRRGIRWWSGPEVTPRDIAAFIHGNLESLARERGHGQWTIPGHSFAVNGDSLVISWNSAPAFGPWILDGAPFWREASQPSDRPWECAGLYRITTHEVGLRLDPARKSDNARPVELSPVWNVKAPVRFLFAANMDPHATHMTDEGTCKNDISLPVFTVISWNPSSRLAGQVAIRRLLAELTPRGELMRSGASYLGDLTSAPIPRFHPGYNKDVDVRPFDLTKTAAAFDKLGYKRAHPSEPRTTPDKKSMKLVLRTPADTALLPRKVLSDAFASIGIAIEFKEDASIETADGAIESLVVPWTLYDPASLFHPSAKPTNPWWNQGTPARLVQQMDAFSVSLTHRKPDFALLRQIHKQIAADEPMTVLMQHRTCLESTSGRLPRADFQDPDWFRAALRAVPN